MFSSPYNRAVVVARVSTQKQREGFGLIRQLEGNTAWASTHGLFIVDTLEQVGSATTPHLAIDAIIHANTLDAQWLVYEHIDRVSRCDLSPLLVAAHIYNVRIALTTPCINADSLRSAYGEIAVASYPIVQEGMPFVSHEIFSSLLDSF